MSLAQAPSREDQGVIAHLRQRFFQRSTRFRRKDDIGERPLRRNDFDRSRRSATRKKRQERGGHDGEANTPTAHGGRFRYDFPMNKKLMVLLLCLLAVAASKKKETGPAPAGAPIPANGVALWLVADGAKPGAGGKLASWSNSAVAKVAATADTPELQPAVVANALNGHAVVRFDGEQNMMVTNVDISPAKMPQATVFAVFSSKTAESSPLRKLYGDDDGGYDRAVGLDSRGDKNYTVFTGDGVQGYFALKANVAYVTADQFTRNDFSGWVNGKPALQKVAATWGDALPNLYLGGTGTAYHEPWQGDLAEIIVYARLLTDKERAQVEDYLGKKYGVAITR